jgi:hypothetical protein
MIWLGPVSLADDGQLPICTVEEFRAVFNTIVEHQLLFDGDITDASQLYQVAGAQLEHRGGTLSQLPLCADAIAIQRLLIQLGGDAVASAALDLADLPAARNPYLLRFPKAQTRIEDSLSTMLGVDRSEALTPAERELPPCDEADLIPLADAAAAFLDFNNLDVEAGNAAETIDAIDTMLGWREDKIPLLPLCAESIDLVQALSAAATDAAAFYAFRFSAGPAARNPYPPLLETGVVTVTDWLDEWSAIVASQASATTAPFAADGRLPTCAPPDLSGTLKELQSVFSALLERAEGGANLADYSAAEIDFRATRLAQLPVCEEAFALRWHSAEALADVALRLAASSAQAVTFGPPPTAETEHLARASSLWATMENALAESEGRANAASRGAPACSESDDIFLLSYLAPAFMKFTDAALRISQPQEFPPLVEQSYALRQLLWTHLPRCDDALAMGLLMRAIAADTISMIALELAGLPAVEIPYLANITRDMERLFEWFGEFYSACGNVNGALTTYYVIAENIANVRACASTTCAIVTTASRGQRLDVVDDLSNWYEIILPTCETAFIAGFLASQTPPPR